MTLGKNLGGKDRNNVDEQIRIGLKHIKQANNYTPVQKLKVVIQLHMSNI